MTLPIVYHPNYGAPLPDQHRFPMPKFKLLHDRLLADGVVRGDRVFTPTLPAKDLIALVQPKIFHLAKD
jgi:hypothetical protein